MIISSSSFPDLNAHCQSKSPNSTARHRIPRKPAPTIDIDIIAERYPSPDPSDPFAPLWALRNRTSSVLHATPNTPSYSGPYGSQETLFVEDDHRRRRAYSFNLLSSPYSADDMSGNGTILQPDILGDTDSLTSIPFSGSNLSSPPGPPVKVKPSAMMTERPTTKPSKPSIPKSKGPTKIGHYTPYSQMQTHTRVVSGRDAVPATAHGTTLLQAFPRISTPSLLLPHLQTQKTTHSSSDQARKPHRVPVHHASHANLYANNSSSDTDTDSNSDTYTNSNSKACVRLSPSDSLSSPRHDLKTVVALVRPHTSGGSPANNGNGRWFSRSKSSNHPSSNVNADGVDQNREKYQRSQSALGMLAYSNELAPQSLDSKGPSEHEHGHGQGTPGRFAKFLSPKKISFLRNGGEKELDNNKRPSTDPGLNSRSRPRLRPVSKASISSPQSVMSTTVFWDHGCSRPSSRHRFNDRNEDGLGHDASTPAEMMTIDDQSVDLPVVNQSRRVVETEMMKTKATTNITNRMNLMTKTNSTNMNMTNLDGHQMRYGHGDNRQKNDSVFVSVAIPPYVVLDGPESNVNHAKQDQKALETDTVLGTRTSNSNLATQKKQDSRDDSDCNDTYSHGPSSKRVLHPLTISELTDRPISDDNDARLIVLRRDTIESRRRYSLDIIDGRRAAGIPIAPLTLTSTQQKMLDQPEGHITDTSTLEKKKTTSFFRVMTRTMKPGGPRPNTTEGRLQALTVPDRNVHVRTPPVRAASAVTPSTSGASFVSKSGEENKGHYMSPHPAPYPPIPSANASASGKERSTFLSMKKPSMVNVKDDKELEEDARRKKRRSEKSGNGSLSTIPVNLVNTHSYPSEGFSFPTEWTLPSAPQLTLAASLPLTSEDGTHVSFGSLFASTRTIVIFIRHFWCPLCQDYMSSLKSFVRPEMLARWPKDTTEEEAKELRKRLVKFVVVSNGAHGMIGKYRKMFGLPFKVYTDPELRVYRALGMGRDGGAGEMASCARHSAGDHDDAGHCNNPSSLKEGQRNHSFHQAQQRQLRVRQKARGGGGRGGGRDKKDQGVSVAGEETEAETEKSRISGGYVKHGLVGGIAMVVVRAIKVGMPVWEKGGDVGQLGGEFIFGPGLSCTYAHRMQHTRGHAPIEDVLAAAGIDVPSLVASSSSTSCPEKHGPTLPSTPVKEGGESPSAVVSNNAVLPSLATRKGGVSVSSSLEVGPDHPRPRLSSLRNLKGSISLSRAVSVASAISISLIQKSLHGGGAAAGVVAPNLAEGIVEIQSKRHTRRYSVGFENVGGMMSREEEERWMESRQASMERMREKKDMRRGILRSRTVSVDSSRGDAAAAAAAAVVASVAPEEEVVIQPEKMCLDSTEQPSSLSVVLDNNEDLQEEGEEEEMTPTATRRALSVNGDWGSDGDDEGGQESDRDSTPNPSLSLISQRSLESLNDTASSWSTRSASPHDGGSYLFMDDVVL